MIKVYPLKEVHYQVTKSKEFQHINPIGFTNIEDGYILTVRPFLIHFNNELILIDAGYGLQENNQSLLVKRIEEIGFSASAVTRILISHLHKDHIGGIGKMVDNKLEVYFQNATIYIHEDEMNYTMNLDYNHPSYNFDVVKGLQYHPQVKYLRELEGEIIKGISYEKVGGHVPHQMVFWIKEGNETIFYGADNLPQLSYLKYDISFKNDVDGKTAQKSRKIWQSKMENEHWTVLFYHGKNTIIKKF